MVMDDLPSTDAHTVAATEASFRIIEALKRKEETGVSELARELDLPKSTTHKHLTTLHSIGYVAKDDGNYRLSLGFLGLGIAARSHFEIIDLAEEPLQKLAETTEQVVSLMLAEHGYGFHALRFTPPEARSLPFHEGERLPLHATAGGKAILAYLPKGERQQVLEHTELTALTDTTTTDLDELSKELQSVHDQRRAYDNGEFRRGVQCIAAPITNENNVAVGAISVTVQSDEMTKQRLESNIGTFLGSTSFSIQARLESA